MPVSPFDFEDPERFGPVEFPEEPDIHIGLLGVRLTRDGKGWICPHQRMWSENPEAAALQCLEHCDEDET